MLALKDLKIFHITTVHSEEKVGGTPCFLVSKGMTFFLAFHLLEIEFMK
jgi:hypothetical protein